MNKQSNRKHIISGVTAILARFTAIPLSCLVFALFLPLVLSAQNGPSSESELHDTAEELFSEQKFIEAMGMYSQLLSLHPTSADYNYRYGATLVYGDPDKEKSFKHLRYAIGKSGVPADVHYFLGRAYHLNYQFAEAIEQYRLYSQKTDSKDKDQWPVQSAIRQCENGLKLLSNIKDVQVLKKVETSEKEFFRNYDLSDIGGRILVCPEELLTKYDIKSGERFLMYFPGNSSTVFFSSYGNKGENGRDIYRAARLPNGNWSSPVPMTGINTPYDDNYPFLHPDGETFYFSSKGHSSMGGYDIFKSSFDELTDSFTPPENLDFAVNSPDDDVLYVTDKDNRRAYFASARSSGQDRMHVYQVSVTANPLQLVLLKGNFNSTIEGVSRSAEITVVDASTNKEIGTYYTNASTGDYVIDLPRSGRYKFMVDAEGSELAHNGVVEVPGSDEVTAYAQEIQLIKPGVNEKLIIKNSFDQPLSEDLYALAQGVLKDRAGLDVNYQESEDTEDQVAEKVEDDVSSAYMDAGYAQSLSNEKILENALGTEKSLENKSEEIRDQMNYAFTLADMKRENAAKASRDAEDYLRLADAVGEEEISSKYLMKAMASKFAAERLSEESMVAVGLAQQLSERLSIVEQKEQKAEILARELKQTLESGNKEEIVAKLTAFREFEAIQGVAPDSDADEYQLLRDQAREEQKSADVSSRMAQDLREEESSLEMRIRNRKLELTTAKNKDKPDIQQEIDVLEEDLKGTKDQIEKLFSGLETAQSEALLKTEQAELYRKITENQTDTYIPAERYRDFRADEATEMKQKIKGVQSETAGMEFNMTVVRDILEEEQNVAISAFENSADFDEFVKQYQLPVREPEKDESMDEKPVKDREAELRDQIASARDWMAIVDESVDELQQQREGLPEGERRDSIDQKLTDFQELKYKKVREIERAQDDLAALSEDEADQLTAVESSPVNSPSGNDRATQTTVQTDPIIARIDPEYEQNIEELASRGLPAEEELKQKVELDQKFIEDLSADIQNIEQKPESVRTESEQRELERMKILRRQMSEEVAFAENHLESKEEGARVKTSTEILLEANGLGEDTERENTDDEMAATTVAPEAIPESVDYSDIDPEYETAVQRVRLRNLPEKEQLNSENQLHEQMLTQIDERIAAYSATAESSEGENKLRAERAISQLQQIGDSKEFEIQQNKNEIERIRREDFADDNSIIVAEVDTAYVQKYWSIEQADEEPYFKTIQMARLEQQTVESIDQRVVELVAAMDEATVTAEKERIQETIQDLGDKRQEKVIAYESLFAQAEQLSTGDPELAESVEIGEPDQSEENILPEDQSAEREDQTSEEGEPLVAADQESRDERSDNEPETTPQTQLPTEEDSETASDETEAEEDAGSDSTALSQEERQSLASSQRESLEQQVEESLINAGNLESYTVFGEVSELNYKSLNASLEMETVGGDLQRHRERLAGFVREYSDQPLDETGRNELTGLLRDELRMQERIAEVNQREMEYFSVGNEEKLEVATSAGRDLTEIRNAQKEAEGWTKEAASLREQAKTETDASARLQLIKSAFQKEVQAIDQLERVNRNLDAWQQGDELVWENTANDESVVVNAEPLAQLRRSAATVSESEEPLVESESTADTAGDAAVAETSGASSSDIDRQIQDHFNLSPNEIQQIESRPVYRDWFQNQYRADSLEALRKARFTEAEDILTEAEELLIESEAETQAAEAETDEALQNEKYDRAAELQRRARELFDRAGTLRDEMNQYSESSRSARREADSLLAGMSGEEAQTIEQISANRVADVLADEYSVDETVQTRKPETDDSVAEAIERNEEVGEESTDPVAEEDVDLEESIATANDEVEAEEPAPPIRTEESRPPAIDFSAGIESVFEVMNEAVYSDENPIPVGVDWPDGLVFAVQVGAFRNPIPQDLFRGFTPIRGERIRDGITRYSAGIFQEFNNANAAKNTIRGLGYNDAFVVAYLNGERIALNRALSEDEAADIIADAAFESARPTSRDESESQSGTITAPTQQTPAEDFTPAPSATAYYNDADAAPAVQVERVRGLFFTVQVGVYSNPVSAASLNNITPLNSELTANENIRYTSGMFPSVEYAQTHRELVINAGIADAFVTAYYNGKRISVSEAREILDSGGSEVLAGSERATQVEPESSIERESQESPAENEVPEEEESSPGESRAVPDAPAFTPGDFADASDFEPEDIRFVLDLGSFGSGMPQNTADAILQIPDAGVSRLQLPNGRTHYLSRPTSSYNEAESLRLRFVEAGVPDAEVRAMALGFLLRLEDARRITGQ